MCRIRRTSDWAYRILLESYYWEHTSFYTFTYDDQHIPILLPDKSIIRDEEGKIAFWQRLGGVLTLQPKDMQDFFKRLRKRMKIGKIKYYMSGEYGDDLGRPHYHAIIFGIRPKYHEEEVTEIWGMGFAQGKTFCRERAQYVAGYIQKKLYGDMAVINQPILSEKRATARRNEVRGMIPPFSRMSKGIGLNFASEFAEKIKKDLTITIDGREIGMPRYFTKKLELKEPLKVQNLKKQAKVVGKSEVTRYLAHGNDVIPEIAQKQLKRARLLEQRKLSLKTIYGESRS